MTVLFAMLRAVTVSSLAGGVAGVLLWVWFRCVKRTAPTVQYYVWMAALLSCVVPLRFRWQTAGTAAVPLEQVAVRIVKTAETPLPPPTVTNLPQLAWGDVFAAVWLTVAAVLFFGYLVKHAVAVRHLRRTTVETECAQLLEYTARRVRVRVGDTVTSPMMVGLFRPTLYLPCRTLEDTQLRHVLAHETVHLHRGDLWVKPLALLVRCVCWFNPLVYGMYRCLCATCEISCDVAAVKKTGGDAAAYLSTVLYLMCNGRGMSNRLSTAMADNARRVKERFRVVSHTASHRVATAISAVAAVTLLTGALCVGGVVAGREEVSPVVPLMTEPVFSTPATEAIPPAVEADTGLLWPLNEDNGMTASYGYRWGEFHRGIDIGGIMDDTVRAAAAGKVLCCEPKGYNGGYGISVTIDHGNGLWTKYTHLNTYMVAVGDYVTAGQPIATLGMTGNVTGPCLHFEVLENGETVDPMPYFVNVEEVSADDAIRD